MSTNYCTLNRYSLIQDQQVRAVQLLDRRRGLHGRAQVGGQVRQQAVRQPQEAQKRRLDMQENDAKR